MFWSFLFLTFLFNKSASITNTQGEGSKVFDDSTIIVSLENYNVSNLDGESIDFFHTLPPYSTSRVVLTEIPPNIHFVVMQVHSYLDNVTFSLDEVPVPKNSITGTNVGLVKIYQKTDMMFYITYNSSSAEEVLLAVQAYSKEAPIPGGCNMEFQVEISPFLMTTYNEAITEVSFAASAPPLPFSQSLTFTNDECNIKSFPVQHKMYHQYFPERDFSKETYFSVLKSMMTKGRIQKSGVPVYEKLTNSPLKRIFASYPGTGNAFVVISQFSGRSSVYVPSFTYGCNDLKDNNTCAVLTTTFSKFFCATLLFMGLFACYFGHYFFRIEIFLFGFLASGVLTYVLVSILYTPSIAFSSSVSVGLITSMLMLLAWTIFGLPIISVILTTLTFGFLLASLIYYPTVDYIKILVFDINFWGIFIGIVLSCPILMLCLAEKANIISCAFLGSYIAMVSIDHYIGSNMRYIVLNIIKRATVDKFNLAVTDPPFQLKDALLCIIWAFLLLTGTKVQRLLMRSKPPYPPPVNPLKTILNKIKLLSRMNQTSERTPLLTSQPPNSTSVHSSKVIICVRGVKEREPRHEGTLRKVFSERHQENLQQNQLPYQHFDKC